MSFTKREFLYRSMAAPLSLALPRFAQAQITLGPATLTTVSDGSLVLPGSFIFEPMPEADLDTILRDFNFSKDRLTPECNLALFRDGTRNVLFDVGSGPDFMPSAGTLVNSLDRLGMTPEDITHVVFTHAHPDHIWGLLDEFDDPLFYNATYMMGRREWDYWWDPETVNTIGDARAAFAVGAKRRMQAIEDAVVLFEDGQEILPGILALSTPGHTPGHMAFEIRHGATAALVLGDAIGNHHVAFQRPDWESGSDQDMALAAKTRGMLFDRIMADDLTVVGFHLPNDGMGRVDKFKDGFKFIEA